MRSLKWIPFAVVSGLFLIAWGTLTFSLGMSYNIIQKGRWIRGLVEIIVTQALAGLAFTSYLAAIFRHPGSPARGALGGGGEHNFSIGGEAADIEAASASRDRADYAGRDYEEEGEGPSAPLLSEVSLLPGQPSFPARTGRQQLNDLIESGQSQERRVKASGLMVKSSGGSRWCAKCDAPKPDRSHHCSTCGICVLRMDHHCPWLASSCVGLRNHKVFFLFLFYTTLLCAYAAQETARALVDFVTDETDGFESSPVSWAVVLFIAFIFGVALLPFTGYHAYLICKNRTTIESMEGQGRIRVRAAGPDAAQRKSRVESRLQSLIRSSQDRPRVSTELASDGQDSSSWKADEALSREERKALKKASKINIYDLGPSENWKQIMGRRWYHWVLPWGDP